MASLLHNHERQKGNSRLFEHFEDRHEKMQWKIKNFSRARASFLPDISWNEEDVRSTLETKTAWWEVLGLGQETL